MTTERTTGHRWGHQTELAVANFPISGEQVPPEIIRALAAIKSAAAAVNAQLGVLDGDRAAAIAAAGDEIARGDWADQFPVDVFQTGSGTSTNMNMNEVIAHRAGEILGDSVHPNDHVNASQSSNDAFPSAIRIAVAALIESALLPGLGVLAEALDDLSAREATTVKMGRTHLMDAVPMTFGQEVGGWARSVRLAMAQIESSRNRLYELPLGGTAVGTGLNAPPRFGALVAAALAERTGLALREAEDHFQAQSSQDVLVEVSAACRGGALVLHKIAGDLRLLNSGPTGGIGEIRLATLQAGSSIMPGKVNPVVPEAVQQVAAQIVGNDATMVFASTMSTLQLNTAMPVMGLAGVRSVRLLAAASSLLASTAIEGLTVNADVMEGYAASSPALVTVLNPEIGYDRAAEVVKMMSAEGLSLAEALERAGIEVDLGSALLKMTGQADS